MFKEETLSLNCDVRKYDNRNLLRLGDQNFTHNRVRQRFLMVGVLHLMVGVLHYWAVLLHYLESLFGTKIMTRNLLLNTNCVCESNSGIVIDIFDLVSCHIHCNWTLHIF